MLLTPSPCHKLSHLHGPPLERDVLYGRPHTCILLDWKIVYMSVKTVCICWYLIAKTYSLISMSRFSHPAKIIRDIGNFSQLCSYLRIRMEVSIYHLKHHD